MGVFQEAELFMLGPDAPLVLGLVARGQKFSQLVEAFDGPATGLGNRHQTGPFKAAHSEAPQVSRPVAQVKGCGGRLCNSRAPIHAKEPSLARQSGA